jgi:tetratricopeptide (TPR) repeat protein
MKNTEKAEMNHKDYWFRTLSLAILNWLLPLARRLGLLLIWPLLLYSSAYATFSIVAIDPATGEMGSAVASRYFAVGAVVPWAEAGVGAVATQANVNVGYGSRALELLKQGLTAQQTLDRLLAEDSFQGKDGRQIAIIDAKGNVAVFTGTTAQDWKGHKKGATYSVQGNILVGAHVVEAMGRAFEATTGELSERLYAAFYAPNDADVHMNLGCIAYLAGEREKALKAFQRAKQLTPDFQKAWDAISARPAYKKITEDQQFVDKVIKELTP